ncbi:hypothetical protein ABZY19_38035 [Streptomyces sp. NPDC006475]|uniref:hypothetical protein n=1 Tax=Streptomyces sp. NPDC006475 TaxID=3155719 RepID=UPI0033B3F8CB
MDTARDLTLVRSKGASRCAGERADTQNTGKPAGQLVKDQMLQAPRQMARCQFVRRHDLDAWRERLTVPGFRLVYQNDCMPACSNDRGALVDHSPLA